MIPGRIALRALGTDGVTELLRDIIKDQFDNLTYVKAIEDLLEEEMDEENREILMEQRNEALSYITVLEQQLVVLNDYKEDRITMDDLLGM
jgi:hypothetical protein